MSESATVIVLNELAFLQKNEPPTYFDLTEIGNSNRFALYFAKACKYVYNEGGGAWYLWDGKRWCRDYGCEIMSLAMLLPQFIAAESTHILNEEIRTAYEKFSRQSAKLQHLRNVLELCKSEQPFRTYFAEMDNKPYYINFGNGTYDLENNTLHKHNQEFNLTKISPINYRKDAKCRNFQSFLKLIFNDNLSVINFIQRAVGYSLSADVSEQCMFFLYGNGQNGKTTLLQVIRALLGEYGKQADPDLLISKENMHPTSIADLVGSRMVVTTEIDDGKYLAEALMKQLTGGDPVKARFMRQDFFEFEPTFKIWMAANHKPKIKGTDMAIWRRIMLIPFNVTIPPADRIKNFYEKKLRNELSGILAWAIEGCKIWMENGLNPPEEVFAAVEKYRNEMDAIGEFIAESCVIGDEYEESGIILYENYREWCKASGLRPFGKFKFYQKLIEKGFDEQIQIGKKLFKGIIIDARRKFSDEPPF